MLYFFMSLFVIFIYDILYIKLYLNVGVSMDNNFFDERVSRWYDEDKGKKFLKFFSIILIFSNLIVLVIILLVDPKAAPFLLIAFGIFFGYSIYFSKDMDLRETEILHRFEGMNGLWISNKEEDAQAVYDYINDSISNNEINFRHKAFPERRRTESDKNSETILLPKYLLDCRKRTVMAIPIDQVYWVVAEQGKFQIPVAVEGPKDSIPDSGEIYKSKINSKVPVVSIYCKYGKTKGILCKDMAEARSIAYELNVYFPNYIGESTKELQKMFSKNRNEFIKMYEQKKLEYDMEHKNKNIM